MGPDWIGGEGKGTVWYRKGAFDAQAREATLVQLQHAPPWMEENGTGAEGMGQDRIGANRSETAWKAAFDADNINGGNT